MVTVTLAGDEADGTITLTPADTAFPVGSTVTASADPAEGRSFFCWTVGGYLADGGEIVSYAMDYRFTVTDAVTLYANFRDHGSVLVRYHANGGTALQTSDSTLEAIEAAGRETTENEIYWDDFSLAYFLYPNTPGDMGYFAREGYTLVGYSTEPDGSGSFYNLGGKAFEDTDHVIELWCVWREQSPKEDFTFVYNNTYGGWYVTDYTGPGGMVCIPDTVDGSPVVGVGTGAFSGNDTINSIVFPSCMKRIEDYSCSGCENLYYLVLFDSLDYLSDASFDGDTALYRVFFSAATNPVYTNWFNNHAKKIELMRYYMDSERPVMIVIGGSSTAYSVDARQLESLLDRDYLVLNCASNGANLFNMVSDWAMWFMDEGDFLLQVIEYSYWQTGGVQCTWETFRSFESCYNVFSWTRAGKYSKLFDCFNTYLAQRRTQTERFYEDYVSSLAGTVGYYDDRGTLTVTVRANGSDSFWSGRRIYFYGYGGEGYQDWLYDFMIYYANVQYWKLDRLGVDYAMAFPPLNRNSLYDYQTDAAMEAWEAYMEENLNIAIISDLQENIAEPAIMFDDDYHLSTAARTDYTARLARDQNAYFASVDAEADEADAETAADVQTAAVNP